LVHCRNEHEARTLKADLQARLAECRLELHPTKTKIVYCKDENRKGAYPNVGFDFLGYCFRPRTGVPGTINCSVDSTPRSAPRR
jgi:hypothetical protein